MTEPQRVAEPPNLTPRVAELVVRLKADTSRIRAALSREKERGRYIRLASTPDG